MTLENNAEILKVENLKAYYQMNYFGVSREVRAVDDITVTMRKNEEVQQLLEKANRVIKQVAETEKYDLILQEAVYINPKHDITDKVLSGLNSAK